MVVKPDNGVGASHTYKLTSDQELESFMAEKEADVPYIMEEFVHAEVNSYDAIIDDRGEPLFETGNVTPMSIMDIVNENDNSVYYILRDLPEDTRKAGRDTVKAFGVKSRFVHFEFFRLLADQLVEIRAKGFAYECEESTRGIRCIGVPLRKNGRVAAALSVAFPLERYSPQAATRAEKALDEARRQIERMLCSVELQF